MEIFFQSQVCNLSDVVQAVEVDVIQRKSPVVLPDDDERWAEDVFFYL